ncbi:hypothetical protein [Richelia sinica]|jgi:hypothetical protein|nr:hypothetical protein [Richelia sinica]MBD2665409.1 hypothetical protein [Richelia sinica FACHB-800]
MSNNTVSQNSQITPRRNQPPMGQDLGNCVETLGLANFQQHLIGGSEQRVVQYCSKQASLEFWGY